MARRPRPDPKHATLREQGLLHSQPDTVTDRLFLEYDFFDAHDLLQVRYELVRCVLVDGRSVTSAATAFGVSRPTFYQAQSAFLTGGLAGLLPHKRGPRGRHKLNDEVLAFLEALLAEDDSLATARLAQQVFERFAVKVHPRSIERALRQEKKPR
ncbi:MAG: helix-turn-helix domain-containing protein [Gammaproteobacteria bacterium]